MYRCCVLSAAAEGMIVICGLSLHVIPSLTLHLSNQIRQSMWWLWCFCACVFVLCWCGGLVSCLSHTCWPSRHHTVVFSLLAAWLFPLITVVFIAETCATACDFFLLSWHFVESVDSIFCNCLIISQSKCDLRAASPQSLCHSASCTSVTRQNTSVDLPVSHSPVPPPQPRSPSTVSPGHPIYCANCLSISLQPIHPSNLINTYKPRCPFWGQKYKTLKIKN